MQHNPLGNMRDCLSPQQVKSALALATRFHLIRAGKQGPAIFSFVSDDGPATVSITRGGTVVYVEGDPPPQREMRLKCKPNLHQEVLNFLRQ